MIHRNYVFDFGLNLSFLSLVPAHATRKAMSKPGDNCKKLLFKKNLVKKSYIPRQRTSVHERSLIGPLSSWSATAGRSEGKFSHSSFFSVAQEEEEEESSEAREASSGLPFFFLISCLSSPLAAGISGTFWKTQLLKLNNGSPES